jgi:F-type H+-transporting ATPase subunit gamma
MPSTRDIRRRIRSVKNIKQVTRAMNMIATARLRRAQAKAESARPYAERISAVLQDVQACCADGQHPLLAERPVTRIGLVAITSDRGLCGAFNANLIREVEEFLWKQTAQAGLITVGRKGREYFERHSVAIDGARSAVDLQFPQPSREVALAEFGAISKAVMTGYVERRYDRVYLAYTQFVSVLKSMPVVKQLLPLEKPMAMEKRARAFYQFEPAAEMLLDTLLPQYVEVLLYRALAESQASEQAARVVAMNAAADGAEEMIGTLTRKYNRVRQASITTQILEVVSGAEALEQKH